MTEHVPVLLKQVLNLLCRNQNGLYLDVTGGRGGHSAALLKNLGRRGSLWICDVHSETVDDLRQQFHADKRVFVIESRFSRVFDNLNFSFSPQLKEGFDGILADLGISSVQLENPALGMGFQLNRVPLDMRLDRRLEKTAADLLKELNEAELADLFYELGGERFARRMARAIFSDRQRGIDYDSTDKLRGLCERVLGRFYLKRKIHPATKVFQALRMAVNQDVQEVSEFVKTAPFRLKPGGRLVMISFHSGEDRIVKNAFRALAGTGGFFLPSRKVIKPDRDEILRNPRSRSARLRVMERKEKS